MLAWYAAAWQGVAMPEAPSRTPLAGGALIAILPVIGALVGLFAGEATIGFLIGLGIGIGAAIAIWLQDRR